MIFFKLSKSLGGGGEKRYVSPPPTDASGDDPNAMHGSQILDTPESRNFFLKWGGGIVQLKQRRSKN